MQQNHINALAQYPKFRPDFFRLCCFEEGGFTEELRDKFKEYLDKIECNPSCHDPVTKVTPLMAVCRRNAPELVEELLYVEADATR